MTDAIRVRDLTFAYRGATGATLRDLSLTVPRGRKVLLMGASGSGKTTLFQCLTGICPKFLGGRLSGGIEIMGHDIRAQSVYDICRSVNVVFQNPDDQLSSITVEDELAFGLENYSLPRDDILSTVTRVLDAVGLEEFRHKYVFHLSGGQRQRLALGSVLALDPPILLLDEPTSNLDPQGTRELLAIIEQLNRRDDLTLLIVQRQADEIIEHVDEIVVMAEGRVIDQGTPVDVLARSGRELRERHGLWLPQVVDLWVERGDRGTPMPGLPLNPAQAIAMLADGRKPSEPFAASRVSTASSPSTDGCRAEASAPTAVSVRDVRFVYDDGTVGLDGVNLDIPVRGLTAIIGQNGSGKSTLATLLAGLRRPTSGRITTHEPPPGNKARPRGPRGAFVFQFPDLQFVQHTVLDEMAHGLLVMGRPAAEARAAAEEQLRALGFVEHRLRHPYTLSAGEKRLLSVACMVMPPPELLILDEPTYGLDSRTTRHVMELVGRCREQGTTVVLITHDMRLVAEHADHTVVLVRGRVTFEGGCADLFAADAVLLAAALAPPPVYEVARGTIGSGALTVAELCRKLESEPVRAGPPWLA